MLAVSNKIVTSDKKGILKIQSKTLKQWKNRPVILDMKSLVLRIYNQSTNEVKYNIDIDLLTGIQIFVNASAPLAPANQTPSKRIGFTLSFDHPKRKILTIATSSVKVI